MSKNINVLSEEEFKKSASLALEQITRFGARKILVIGDVGLDEYLTGDVRRISPEAPVPVLEVTGENRCAGLSGNVAQNVISLGGQVALVGVVGADRTAEVLSETLKTQGVLKLNFIVAEDRPTTRKVRAMSGQHHIVRIDHEVRRFIQGDIEKKILAAMESELRDVDGVIIQDYGKGMITESLCQEVISQAHAKGKKVLVDPHRTTPIKYYKNADLIKPNQDEAFILSGLNLDDLRAKEDSILEVGEALLKQTLAKELLITQGQKGVMNLNKARALRIPTQSRQVYDVTGAGDTFLAAFSLSWFSGMDVQVSAIVANAASGVVVGKVGSVPCSREELVQALEEFTSA